MYLGRQEDAQEFLRYVVDRMQEACLNGHKQLVTQNIEWLSHEVQMLFICCFTSQSDNNLKKSLCLFESGLSVSTLCLFIVIKQVI